MTAYPKQTWSFVAEVGGEIEIETNPTWSREARAQIMADLLQRVLRKSGVALPSVYSATTVVLSDATAVDEILSINVWPTHCDCGEKLPQGAFEAGSFLCPDCYDEAMARNNEEVTP